MLMFLVGEGRVKGYVRVEEGGEDGACLSAYIEGGPPFLSMFAMCRLLMSYDLKVPSAF